MLRTATICYVLRGNEVLLIKKKIGFGTGKWNGVGGHVEEDETVEEAAARELTEETSIVPKSVTKVGELNMYFNDADDWNLHIFVANEFRGEARESNEGLPKWFSIDEIPYSEMLPDDEHWMPLLLDGKRFEGEFYFENEDKILKHEVREI